MYERHFGFTVKPFAMTPDPAFMYPSRQHAMALTMLEYGLESQAAFSLLTGEIGSGKTMLVRKLLRQLADQVVVGLVSNAHGRSRRWASLQRVTPISRNTKPSSTRSCASMPRGGARC